MAKTGILVVEDEAIVAMDLADQLQRLGYLVLGVTDTAESALELSRNLKPDLVLMDLCLSGAMDGVEAAGLIHHELDLPVVFLTAHSDRVTLERAKLTEPFGYLIRPFGEPELETHIEMALYKHLAERRLRDSHAELERRVAERTHELALALNQVRNAAAERLRVAEELRINEHVLIHQSRQAAMGEMINNIAHQWRQPLNALGLLVQQSAFCCELEEVDRQAIRENSAKAMQVIRHMSDTINDFRNFFNPRKEKVSFSIEEEVKKTLSLLEGSLGKENIQIEVEKNGSPVSYGHPNEFSQVLLNILMNARDALVERKVAGPKVRITVGNDGDKAVVTVVDNAGGVPEEIIGSIFDPYFTTKGSRGGTGVGLFMSKTIIEKHMGGRLSVANKKDGAEFRIVV